MSRKFHVIRYTEDISGYARLRQRVSFHEETLGMQTILRYRAEQAVLQDKVLSKKNHEGEPRDRAWSALKIRRTRLTLHVRSFIAIYAAPG